MKKTFSSNIVSQAVANKIVELANDQIDCLAEVDCIDLTDDDFIVTFEYGGFFNREKFVKDCRVKIDYHSF